MSCNRCERVLDPQDTIACTAQGCSKKFDSSCAGLSLTTFSRMGKRKDTWKCIGCRGQKGAGKDSENDEDDDQIVVLRSLFKEFKDEIKAKLSDVENGLQYQSKQLDDVLTSFREMKKTVTFLQTKQEELAKENQSLKKTVKDLQCQVMEMDQRSLDHNLEVNGVPESINEKTIFMEALCTSTKVNIPTADTYNMKRSFVGAPGKPKPIILSFQCKQDRDGILKAAKKYKPKLLDLTKNPADVQPIYINEQLTPQLKDLFYKANQIKREKKYAYLWISEGKILLKKNDTANVIRIRNIEDLN